MFLALPTLPDDYTENCYVALVFIDRAIANWLCDVHQAMLAEKSPYPSTKISPYSRCYQYWLPVSVYAPESDEPLYLDAHIGGEHRLCLTADVQRDPLHYAGRNYPDKGNALTKLIVDHDSPDGGVVFQIRVSEEVDDDHTDIVDTYQLSWKAIELLAQGKYPCSR